MVPNKRRWNYLYSNIQSPIQRDNKPVCHIFVRNRNTTLKKEIDKLTLTNHSNIIATLHFKIRNALAYIAQEKKQTNSMKAWCEPKVGTNSIATNKSNRELKYTNPVHTKCILLTFKLSTATRYLRCGTYDNTIH